MTSPVDQRLAAVASSPSGHIAPSGTASYRSALNGNASEFARWRRDPMTRKVLGALQDAVLHMPVEVQTEDRLVQYGVSQGLAFAMQLVADPSAIWPGVFGKGTSGNSDKIIPVMDFDTSIDDAFGIEST